MRLRLPVRRETLRKDMVAGVVLGVESVPDGLAAGLLAGVNPLSGLYAYLFGTAAGSLFTSSAFMAVQATGAMAIIVADVPAVHSADDPARALFTLSVLTGVVMLAAGFLRLGSVLRFVSNSVMVGFISAVALNIVLGQLANLTGYKATGANRVVRAVNTLAHPGELHLQSVAIGVLTIALILVIERTRLGALGLVLAVIVTSAAVAVLGWGGVATVSELSAVPPIAAAARGPRAPSGPFACDPGGVTRVRGTGPGGCHFGRFPELDGPLTPMRLVTSSGKAQRTLSPGYSGAMPVGGSMSASSLNKAAGARSRIALMIAGVVMAVVILAFASRVGRIAMPALAGLLILVGYRTIKPDDLQSVWKTGAVQKAVLGTSFVLTMVIPLQYAVLVGVGLSVILHVVRQSNQVIIKRLAAQSGLQLHRDRTARGAARRRGGRAPAVREPVLRGRVSAGITAPGPGWRLPNSVVILRLRGRTDLGTTFMDVLRRYAQALAAAGSKLVIVSASERIQEQLRVTGVTELIGPENIYTGDERIGATVKRAYADGTAWIEQHQRGMQTDAR